ncbi:MAG TPA: molybdopterin cofactor-binding domain-containing protein [Xanthobacteraceae bacterium]|nr:molybdopterin cofactor-binding domain-containing protein [Xanthobacteraceae bacterium]
MKDSINTILARETGFSRRDLLKGGGALIVGFSLSPALSSAARADAVASPDPKLIDSWIAVHADNTATIIFGKCELGQGNTTGMLQIAGEELDLDMHQLSAVRCDTHVTPDQGATTSSSSIERGGPQLRAAAAEARQALLQLASARLNAPVTSLNVASGVVSVAGDPGRSVKYGELLGGKPFAVKLTGTAPRKAVEQYKLVGTRVPRVDLPDKVAAKYTHMQHVRVAGMLHGRIVRPRGQGPYGYGAKPLDIDQATIRDIPGARLVRKGDFIGVVAEREWDAVRAAQALKVTWEKRASLPGNASLYQVMRAAKTTDTRVVDDGDITKGFAQAEHVASATYELPYQAHLPFGPNCAIADVGPDAARVISSTQDVYNSRRMLADTLGLPPEKIHVQYYEGSGTFGHSCYEDAAQAAAIMSQVVGKPVRVQFMRWDEHGWDNFGPAHIAEVRAGIDAAGKIVAYEYQGWQHGWHVIETSQELAQLTAPQERTGGSNSIIVNRMSTGAMYAIPNRRVTSHAIPMLGLLKGSPLRSPMDMHYSFASEQVVDDLAHKAGIDPLDFRRRNIAGERWLGVLNAAAAAAGWTPRPAASLLSDAEVVTGRGIGIGTHHVSFGAAVAEIEVNRRTGVIVAKKLYGALDAGLAVNPGLIENQIVGMMVQATSRILKEEVTFSDSNVTSLDWVTYPILRFAEHPEVTPVVVQRLHEPSTGAGEEVMGSTGAAIANAFFDATGVRLTQYPMTPERVRAALAAARI